MNVAHNGRFLYECSKLQRKKGKVFVIFPKEPSKGSSPEDCPEFFVHLNNDDPVLPPFVLEMRAVRFATDFDSRIDSGQAGYLRVSTIVYSTAFFSLVDVTVSRCQSGAAYLLWLL